VTKEVLSAGVVDALKTHDRNVTDDMSAVSELEHAGVSSDEVESGFGNVDYVGFRTQCPTTTVFGVAHAQNMGLLPLLAGAAAAPLGETRADKV